MPHSKKALSSNPASEFACSHRFYVGSVRGFPLPPTIQRHAISWVNLSAYFQDSVKQSLCVYYYCLHQAEGFGLGKHENMYGIRSFEVWLFLLSDEIAL